MNEAAKQARVQLSSAYEHLTQAENKLLQKYYARNTPERVAQDALAKEINTLQHDMSLILAESSITKKRQVQVANLLQKSSALLLKLANGVTVAIQPESRTNSDATEILT